MSYPPPRQPPPLNMPPPPLGTMPPLTSLPPPIMPPYGYRKLIVKKHIFTAITADFKPFIF